MEKINLNKKEYVESKAYYDLENKYKALLKSKKKNSESSAIKLNCFYFDNNKTLAVGNVSFKGKWISTKLDISYLERIVKALKNLNYTSVSIVFSQDNPVVFGDLDKNKKEASGIILAPMVDKDD